MRMHSEANELASALASSVAFHLTSLPRLRQAASAETHEIDHMLQEVGKPVGGLLLVHPMYVLSQTSIVSAEMRRYARRTLRWIGKEMGIGEAIVLAQVYPKYPQPNQQSLIREQEQSTIPFLYAAKGHVLIWAGMLVQSPFVCSGIRAG